MAKNNKNNSEKPILNSVNLSALNPFILDNVTSPVEKEITGKDFVSFGDNNLYFNYLYDLYKETPTLNSVVNATVDYITGDDIVCNVANFETSVNNKGETMYDIIQKIAMDYVLFGGFAIQIIRNRIGEIAELYYVSFDKLRTNKDNTVIYYSDDWKKSYGRIKTTKFPKFNAKDINPTSIYYFKGNLTKTTYPLPMWNSATIPAEVEKKINLFHLNAISNGFMGSYLFNFNNGVPSDELKEEIEQNLNEKFAGAENAGRIMISFNNDYEHRTEPVKLDADDFADRYDALQKRTREQIFVAFRMSPTLAGIVTESNGFSTQEYSDTYKIFEKSTISPMQKDIIKVFDDIFSVKQSVTITPFQITFDNN